MSYVDGFVIPVPVKNLPAYKRMAKLAGKVWREHGALEYKEWIADDVKVGKLTSFPRSVKRKPGETVVFSWIVWPSKQARDTVNQKMKTDPRMKSSDMPFDGQRMIFGGFEVLLDTGADGAR